MTVVIAVVVVAVVVIVVAAVCIFLTIGMLIISFPDMS